MVHLNPQRIEKTLKKDTDKIVFHVYLLVFFVVGAEAMDSSAKSSLLYAARNGDIETVRSLVTALKENRLSFDLNCTGMSEYISVLVYMCSTEAFLATKFVLQLEQLMMVCWGVDWSLILAS